MTTRPEFQSPLFEKGLKIRKEVLGAEHVQKSLDSATDFTAPMQKLVTEWCWGELWSRPGLDRRTRSIINLSMLSALNRPHEVRLHVRGALNNGLSQEEIIEILLQVAIYCGVPAALDSMKVAAEVLAEEAARSEAAGAA
ncbi:MAG: carboxymuconolactone decarboxylase family protein [Lautropia sp.]|nr:carboxymuconolactone decarboxylase family protein [Lautropia sp.]